MLIRDHGPTPEYQIIFDGTENGLMGKYISAPRYELRPAPKPTRPLKATAEVVLGLIRSHPTPLSRTDIGRLLNVSRTVVDREVAVLLETKRIRGFKRFGSRNVCYEVVP